MGGGREVKSGAGAAGRAGGEGWGGQGWGGAVGRRAMKMALSGSDLDIFSCPCFRPMSMSGGGQVGGRGAGRGAGVGAGRRRPTTPLFPRRPDPGAE